MPGCPMEPKAVRRDSRDCAVRGSSCAPAPSSLLRWRLVRVPHSECPGEESSKSDDTAGGVVDGV